MNHQVKPATLAFRVVIFFARNPRAQLKSREVAERFGTEREHVRNLLLPHVKSRLLKYERIGIKSVGGFYTVGPQLLDLIKRVEPEAAP